MSELTNAFATVDDLEARWHTLTESEKTTAETLLLDASQYVVDIGIDTGNVAHTTLKRVVCAMVKRAMSAAAAGIPDGVTQVNQTTGSFTDGYTFANPNGDLYLLAAEKKALGMGRQKAHHMLADGAYDIA